jgi:copper chaperone CopZ
MFNKYLAIALLYTLLVPFSAAQNNSTEITEKNYVVTVHGLVCELCAYGVAKNIRKLSFIDKQAANKGVNVDIKNQRIFLTLSDEASLDKAALFEAIESGGYKPIDVIPTTQTHKTNAEEIANTAEEQDK